jgi:hypothetical protein
MLIAVVPHSASRSAVPALAATAAAQPSLAILPHFGGLAFLSTGSALKANGITIAHRIQLACATDDAQVEVRPDCGEGAPSLTNTGGSLAPNLASGSTNATVDVKFVRGPRSLAISNARLVADNGLLTFEPKIGSAYVALGTTRPKLSRDIGDTNLANSQMLLTATGAKALNHALGTNLAAGGVITSAFGGNVVYKQANLTSGSAVFAFAESIASATPTGAARNATQGVSLPLVAKVADLNIDGWINAALHYAGGFTFKHGGRTETITNLNVDLRANVINNRSDILHADVNGTEVELATATQSFANEQTEGSTRSEVDNETPLKLTAAAAARLCAGYTAGADIGSLVLTSTVPSV